MKPGDLVTAWPCYLWEHNTAEKSGNTIGNMRAGELAIVLEVTVHGIRVINSRGVVGWIDRKENLSEIG